MFSLTNKLGMFASKPTMLNPLKKITMVQGKSKQFYESNS